MQSQTRDFGPPPPWVDGLTIGKCLIQTAQLYRDHPGVVFPSLGYRKTWREFFSEVRQVAKALMACGVEPGEHVGIWATNWPEWLLAQFATALVGSPLVNVNPAYRARELGYVLPQADIRTLILSDHFKTTDYEAILQEVCPELQHCPWNDLRSNAAPLLRRVVSIKETTARGILPWSGFLELSEGTSEEELLRRAAKVDPQDVVNIQYTSGTTGFPKGVLLTHRNLLMNAYYVGARMHITREDRVCIPVPFYHCFGCVMGNLMCSIYGATIVVPAEVFDPELTLQAVSEEDCTALYGVPTMFIAELNHPDFPSLKPKSLRTGIMAGSPCPVEVMRKVINEMGADEITIAYGLTEASPVITQTRTSDSLEHRVATVGQPLPGLSVRLCDPATGVAASKGQPGELMVRGHGVMKGYYKDPEATQEALTPDRWLHTGDLAVETPDGFYKITGRIKDMVIRGGENIYPREIEEFLYTHPAVADVQVVGVPDAQYGEELAAWIILKSGIQTTEEEIREFCRYRIAHYKVPRYIKFVKSYPTTVTGKVQKFKLRELGIVELGLQDVAGDTNA